MQKKNITLVFTVGTIYTLPILNLFFFNTAENPAFNRCPKVQIRGQDVVAPYTI